MVGQAFLPVCQNRPRERVCENSMATNNAESVREFQPGPGSPRGQPAWGGSVCFETLGARRSQRFLATLKELRCFAVGERRPNSFRVASSKNECLFPRVANAQPWAGIRERFQRYSSYPSFHTASTAPGSDFFF